MVAKINFESPELKKSNTHYIGRIKFFNVRHCLLPVFLFFLLISLLFFICCSVKIVNDLCEISDLKTQLYNNVKIRKKLTDKLIVNSSLLETALDFKLKQLPAIEIMSLLQTSVKTCNGISISEISADTYGMSFKGNCIDSSQLSTLIEALRKSSLVITVYAPSLKDLDIDKGAVFTFYAKLNTLCYAIENDTSLKKGTR